MEVCERAASTDTGDMGFCNKDAIPSLCFISRDNIVDLARHQDISIRDAKVRLESPPIQTPDRQQGMGLIDAITGSTAGALQNRQWR